MIDLLQIQRLRSFKIKTRAQVDALGPKLANAVAKQLRSMIARSDFEREVERYEQDHDVIVEFTHADIGPEHLTDGILATVLDPEAYVLTYVEFVGKGPQRWHLVVARGSNSMGFVFDQARKPVMQIYDGLVSAWEGGGYGARRPIDLAIAVGWLYVEDGQRVADGEVRAKAHGRTDYDTLFDPPAATTEKKKPSKKKPSKKKPSKKKPSKKKPSKKKPSKKKPSKKKPSKKKPSKKKPSKKKPSKKKPSKKKPSKKSR